MKSNLSTVTNSYDALGRMNSKTVNTGSYNFTNGFTYKPGANGSATTMIDSLNNNGQTISYTYDKNGNIETITENGKVIKYHYNELNELIREDNQVLNKTIAYSYDVGGNILDKKNMPIQLEHQELQLQPLPILTEIQTGKTN